MPHPCRPANPRDYGRWRAGRAGATQSVAQCPPGRHGETRSAGRTEFLSVEGEVILEIADNGPGIVEEALDKVFIPFFTTKQDGSGIGLSLCRQIVRAHRGSISVRSEPEVRTVFTLLF
ncbi:MAG: hypothetical protein CME13_01805 [Gemmatimonadetes bacterium]|nr:hypothetical protein [Gemmatimonadota bacterium]